MNKFILLLISAAALFLLSGQADAQRLRSEEAGVEITKPESWHITPGLSSVYNYAPPKGQTENLTRLFKKMSASTKPAIIISKFKEPYADINPSVSVIYFTARDDATIDPMVIVTGVMETMKATVADVTFQSKPKLASLGGKRAAFIRYTIENTIRGKRYRFDMEGWAVASKGKLLLIEMGAKAGEPASTRAELKKIVQSVRLD